MTRVGFLLTAPTRRRMLEVMEVRCKMMLRASGAKNE